jgi:hypothetical protein|tara:strand:+ start:1218 stop:1499 length:282 start_codon:yes stop_codon:yes gene_type:complete
MGYLDGKTLNDLTPAKSEVGKSNLIELTDAEKWAVVEALKAGKSLKVIKRSVLREEGKAKLSLSYRQIKEIESEWKAKIAELTPVEITDKRTI